MEVEELHGKREGRGKGKGLRECSGGRREEEMEDRDGEKEGVWEKEGDE